MNQFACACRGNLALDLLPTAMQKLEVGFKVNAVLGIGGCADNKPGLSRALL